MNNTQFRRLVLDTPTASKTEENSMGSKLQSGGAIPALGSRMRSNIPMTPYCDPNTFILLVKQSLLYGSY